jgi:hypothetical protein
VARALSVARVQDAAAWLALAVLLVLVPSARAADLLGLSRADPAAPWVLAGLLLAAVAVAHAAGRLGTGPRAVTAALAADLAGAVGVLVWLVAADPATAARGTLVLAVVAAGLALQAAVDGLILLQAAGPPVEQGFDRP